MVHRPSLGVEFPFSFPGNGKFEKPKFPGIPGSLFPGKREKSPKFFNFPGNGIPGIPGRKLYLGDVLSQSLGPGHCHTKSCYFEHKKERNLHNM